MAHSPARRSSAERLLFLYSVICALSLETAISQLIDVDANTVPIDRNVLPLAVAFFVTVVPFYHGAFRHLDDFYILDSTHQSRRGALMVDFVILFSQGAMLFALASLTPDRGYFTGTLALLLIIDVVWALVTSMYCTLPGLTFAAVRQQGMTFYRQLIHPRGPDEIRPELTWAFNNLIWLVVLVAVALAGDAVWDGLVVSWLVAVVAVGRTLSDYWLSWSFYFPD